MRYWNIFFLFLQWRQLAWNVRSCFTGDNWHEMWNPVLWENKKKYHQLIVCWFGQRPRRLRKQDILGTFFTFFYKTDNFYDFLFAFLHISPLPKWVSSVKGQNLLPLEAVLYFQSSPFWEWRCQPRWLSWMHVQLKVRRILIQTPPSRQCSFVEIDREIPSTVILLLPLIQEGHFIVSFWWKNVHNTGEPLTGLNLLSKSVVR